MFIELSKSNWFGGMLQGEMILYYESGTIRAKGNYVDGIKDGKKIRYNKSGEVVEEVNYVNGKLQKKN
jgi:antitoxin component YwqK of YwqJK toxin-antitoxin module